MAVFTSVHRRIAGAGMFLLLLTGSLAASKSSNIAKVSQRGLSKDASCPNGWLCQQSSCDAAACSAGEVCISFEGTIVCAPAGQTWCALNPKTFEAVECSNGGVCCHGNCYKSGTVCCDNASIQCTIGDLCLACPSGDTCTTGASTCAAGGGSPPLSSSSSSSKPSSHSTSIRQTTAAPPMTTTKSSSSSTPVQQPASSTTSTPTKPTIVQQHGNYKYSGCYIDSSDSRVLVVANSADASSNGMTVEKCIALADKQNLRYAGLEVGSECFMGNTLHSLTKAPDSDCNTVCAGSPTEYCGQGNRLQVYEDTTWSDPTLDELTQALLQYNNTLFELQTLTGQYNDLIQQWANQQKANGGQKRWLPRRRSRTITVTELDNTLTDMENRYPHLRALLDEAARNGGVLYRRGGSADVLRPGQSNPFVDAPNLQNAQQAFDIPLKPLADVQTAIEDDLRSIAESTSSTTPLLNTARDLEVSGTANNAIGKISGASLAAIAAGHGIFALLALIFLHLHPSSDNSNPSTTPHSQPTSVTVTSTTSSPTASATPYLLVAADGVSVDQFQAFTDKLSSHPDTDIINSPFAIARVVSLNDTELEDVQQNKIVFSATENELPDIFQDIKNPKRNLTLEELPKLGLEKRTDNPRGTAEPGSTIPATQLIGRKGLSGLTIGHLTSLSQKWFTEATTDGFDYVYEKDPGKGTFIYVIDEGVDLSHPEFIGIPKEQIIINNFVPKNTHGTKVAGQAVGKVLGVASSATLVDIASSSKTEKDVLDALTATYNDIIAKGRQGKAVVNMSWSMPSKGRLSQNYWLAKSMRRFIDIGAVPVLAAGNNGKLPGSAGLYDEGVPQFYISSIDGLIIVGSVDENGKRDAFTAKCDARNTLSTCLSAYARGSGLVVADSSTGYYDSDENGTSFAAPIVSGLVAYLMAHPNANIQSQVYAGGNAQIAENVDFIINKWSWSRNPTGGIDWPNIAWNGVVGNACNLNAGPNGKVAATPDEDGGQLVLKTTESPLTGVTNSCP